MENLFNAFISYGRADSKAFATKLHERLTLQGLKVWFDRDDIPPAVDWQNQIDDGIEKTHNFIFIIAPHSVKSPYCRKELELAIRYNKRILPLLHVNCDAFWEQVHPKIKKTNWLFFQEEIDDFDDSFNELIQALHLDNDYVKQHTQLLVKALDWSRNEKQNNYLLIGQERKQAESWLKIKFKERQAPCQPTDIHGDFISESTKNANNLMTDIFISYSEEDEEITQKIANTLKRESFTIWTNKTDIKAGAKFQEQINKGIEEADNLIYLISANSLRSRYCQQEIEYALANNKRIVPLLVEKIQIETIPPEILALQFLDFTEYEDPDKYCQSIDKLIKNLHQDAHYYQEHKILLAKALKWKRQNHNPSILLRGHNLQHFENWLKVARSHSQHSPLPIQVEFIQTSRTQATESSPEVFISYSRVDSDFARRLNEALQLQGKTTWFDQESIPSGTDYQQEIELGIESSDNFLFIISPQSIKSPYCADEVAYAQKLNKRIVTVLHKQVSSEELHPALAKIQWIDFNQHDSDLYANFSELIRTLDTDREHVKNHNKWLQRAREWQEKHKDSDLLLRGIQLSVAENWLKEAETENKQPLPTSLQKEFIQSSKKAIEAAQEAERRRKKQIKRLQRLFLTTVSIGFVVSTFLGWEAVSESKKAKLSEQQARLREIAAIGASSDALFASNQKLEALLQALLAWQKLQQLSQVDSSINDKTENNVELVLRQAVYGVREQNRLLGHKDNVWTVAFSPDGQLIASASGDKSIKLWKLDGTELKTLEGHDGSVFSLDFSSDGKLIASASTDKTIKLWKRDGSLLKTLSGHTNQVYLVTFSSDGQLIASASADKTIKLWKRDGSLLRTLSGHRDEVYAVAFSPDEKLIASASRDKTIKLWKLDGTLLKTLSGHRHEVQAVTFSPDGKLIASASRDKTIKLWKLDGTLLKTLSGHEDEVRAVVFRPDGKLIASGSEDNTIKLWKLDGTLLTTLRGHTNEIDSVSFNPKNPTIIASGSGDNSIGLWKLDNSLLKIISGHTNKVRAVAFSPDGKLIASASDDNTIKLWRREDSSLVKTFSGHSDRLQAVVFSPDGQLIASASEDRTIKLWKLDGSLVKTFSGHSGLIYAIDFSPDGQLIASGSEDNTIKLWRRNGTLLTTFSGHSGSVYGVSFSPDGQLIASGSGDNTVKLWKSDGTLVKTLSGHSGSVYGVSFSPNGQLIASASADKTVKLWNSKGAFLTTLPGHSDKVRAVVFSPDRKVIASASEDKTVIVWNLEKVIELDKVLEYGCNWVRDYLQHNSKVVESERDFCK